MVRIKMIEYVVHLATVSNEQFHQKPPSRELDRLSERAISSSDTDATGAC